MSLGDKACTCVRQDPDSDFVAWAVGLATQGQECSQETLTLSTLH